MENELLNKVAKKILGKPIMKIASGGFSDVFLIKQNKYPAFYLVKIYKTFQNTENLKPGIKEYIKSVGIKGIAKREYSIASSISHPNISKPVNITFVSNTPVIIYDANIEYFDYEIYRKTGIKAFLPHTLDKEIDQINDRKKKCLKLLKLLVMKELFIKHKYFSLYDKCIDELVKELDDFIIHFEDFPKVTFENHDDPLEGTIYQGMDMDQIVKRMGDRIKIAENTYLSNIIKESMDLLARVNSSLYFREISHENVQELELRDVIFLIENIFRDIKKIIIDIFEGIEYLQTKNISHQDLKPDNIIVTKNKVTIIDFGISKISKTFYMDLLYDNDLIEDEDFIFTYDSYGNYNKKEENHFIELLKQQEKMPSIASKKFSNPKTEYHDQWSFGLLIYEIIWGKYLFEEDEKCDDNIFDNIAHRYKIIEEQFGFNFNKQFKSKYSMTRNKFKFNIENLCHQNKSNEVYKEGDVYDLIYKFLDQLDFYNFYHVFIAPISNITNILTNSKTICNSHFSQKIFTSNILLEELIRKCFNIDIGQFIKFWCNAFDIFYRQGKICITENLDNKNNRLYSYLEKLWYIRNCTFFNMFELEIIEQQQTYLLKEKIVKNILKTYKKDIIYNKESFSVKKNCETINNLDSNDLNEELPW